jgi:hypothetical protein
MTLARQLCLATMISATLPLFAACKPAEASQTKHDESTDAAWPGILFELYVQTPYTPAGYEEKRVHILEGGAVEREITKWDAQGSPTSMPTERLGQLSAGDLAKLNGVAARLRKNPINDGDLVRMTDHACGGTFAQTYFTVGRGLTLPVSIVFAKACHDDIHPDLLRDPSAPISGLQLNADGKVVRKWLDWMATLIPDSDV